MKHTRILATAVAIALTASMALPGSPVRTAIFPEAYVNAGDDSEPDAGQTPAGDTSGTGSGTQTPSEDSSGTGETQTPSGDTSGTGSGTQTPSGDTSGTGGAQTPSGDTSGTGTETQTPSGDTSGTGTGTQTPSGDTSGTGSETQTPSGDTSGTGSETQTPSGDTSGTGSGTQTPSGDTSGAGAGTQTPSGDTSGTGSGSQTPSGDTSAGVPAKPGETPGSSSSQTPSGSGDTSAKPGDTTGGSGSQTPSGDTGSSGSETPDVGDLFPFDPDSGGAGMLPGGDDSGEPGSDIGNGDETETPKTLEELRDELLLILGSGGDTDALKTGIDRAIAMGDPEGTLRTYLENTIRLYQLNYEKDQLESSVASLESDPLIGAISSAAAELESSMANPVLFEIQMEIDESAARLMQETGYDEEEALPAMAEAALARLDGNPDSADVAAIVLFSQLRDEGYLSDAGLVTANDGIRRHLNAIVGRKAAMPAALVGALENASRGIARRANGAGELSPNQIVMANTAVSFSNPVFTYNNTVMVSAEDAAEILGGEIVEMEDNYTVVLETPNATLETVRGSSDAYLNDRLQKMSAPVLRFDEVTYMPLDTAALCSGMAHMSIGGYELYYPQ